MLNIGNHISSSKGYLAMGKEIIGLGGNVFAFFTRNPRGGKAKVIDEKDVSDFLQYKAQNGIGRLVAHAPYTMNPCAAKPELREFAHDILVDDLHRLEYTPGNYYNLHPGSHVGQGVETAIELIADQLNRVLQPDQCTTVLLETMSGKGTEVGRSFDELAEIIKSVKLGDLVGVCLDTCHVYSAGYDVVNDLDGVLKEFDKVIGIDKLKAIHLNDSMTPFASNKDRHARLGEGSIGWAAIKGIINHKELKDLPFILETPNDRDGYIKEIAELKRLVMN
ncbi:MAG: deoxyribonuclease IV [Anaerovibrio sp.]|uniref:deoxyribonuclease IV n=1 Tax=Anaerovibrio sp. TaxID=1872532 RepID=UPI0025E26265|nr:deoxyribonuclease IV [Anaerovibrio sp.]MCR5177021.1 deoxyribonuclease IV [Anaerovibrio sp.]